MVVRAFSRRLAVIASLGVLFAPHWTIPCDVVCVAPRPEQILRSHRYVMVGRVTKVLWDGHRGSFTVAAIRVWRGKKKEVVLQTYGPGASCGYVMEEGKVYVVYGNDDPQAIGVCEFAPIPACAAGREIAYFDKATRLPPLSLPCEAVKAPGDKAK